MTPQDWLVAVGRRYPNLTKQVNDILRLRATGKIPAWPDWCFIPMKEWQWIIFEGQTHDDLIFIVKEMARLSAVGAWRYTQGIYRFEPELMEALKDTEIIGEMPVEVLTRLPEYCVYIETPHMSWGDQPLHGFFAHLNYDADTSHKMELRLLLNAVDGELIQLPVDLSHATLEECVKGTFPIMKGMGGVATTTANLLTPFISMLLYLCSDEPEVEDREEPLARPHMPKKSKTKRGLELFPANRSRKWTVGTEIAKAIRTHFDHSTDYPVSGSSKRPHVRRGHWHGFWKGPKTGERTFFYRWLMPIMVNVKQA